MLNLKPCHSLFHNCIDDMIECIANYFGKNVIYSYVNGLSFDYISKINNDNFLLDKFRVSCISYNLEYLSDCINVDVKPQFLDNAKKIVYSVLEINIGHPIGVYIDAYYCPWNAKYYLKHHMPHYFLISGIDRQRKLIYCIDGYLSQNIEVVAYDILVPYIQGLWIFSSKDNRIEPNLSVICLHIIELLKKSDLCLNCDPIRQFAEDIRFYKFSEAERLKYCDLSHSQFIFGLKLIQEGREKLSLLFADLFSKYKYENLQWISKSASYSSLKWKNILNSIVKSFYANDNKNNMDLYDVIIDVANEETKIISVISSLL